MWSRREYRQQFFNMVSKTHDHSLDPAIRSKACHGLGACLLKGDPKLKVSPDLSAALKVFQRAIKYDPSNQTLKSSILLHLADAFYKTNQHQRDILLEEVHLMFSIPKENIEIVFKKMRKNPEEFVAGKIEHEQNIKRTPKLG